ncbi:hypothetical protein COLO4_22208 [Corchorus olitorius]|uniref:Uncharacterized protein n=1 Tax=Corchorus olitorius TaxID=93759 RepID=A0A1R3INH6_9ROSI|nr:hypothetical protein COLO4_22208 [Corchorus olitorius]
MATTTLNFMTVERPESLLLFLISLLDILSLNEPTASQSHPHRRCSSFIGPRPSTPLLAFSFNYSQPKNRNSHHPCFPNSNLTLLFTNEASIRAEITPPESKVASSIFQMLLGINN